MLLKTLTKRHLDKTSCSILTKQSKYFTTIGYKLPHKQSRIVSKINPFINSSY